MIDIEKAEEEFKRYTNKYIIDKRIERKVYHTFRVEELSEKIAKFLKMNEEEIKLAKLIGLLHDIARFEQYTRYKTFDDPKSIDHGNLGVEILKKDNYIRKYIKTDLYDEIIIKAIANHNKYSIEENLTAKEEMYCKIIRDADKLDIMYQATCESWKEQINNIEKQAITLEALEQFVSNQIVDKKYINHDIDRVVVVMGFIYDFNFIGSYKIIKENNYIDKIIDRFNFKMEETKEQMELIRKTVKEYIDNKVKEE